MFCSNCGKPVTPGARFCIECGAVVGKERATTNVPGNVSGILQTLAGGKKPDLIWWAGIGSFAWAAIMVLLVLLQLLLAKMKGDSDIAALGYWNLMVVAAYMTIGFGIFQRKKWAWDWGIGSNILNLLVGIYELTQEGVVVQVLLLPVELFVLYALYSTKSSVVSSGRLQAGVATSASTGQSNSENPPVAVPVSPSQSPTL